jgi:hypothetical protein
MSEQGDTENEKIRSERAEAEHQMSNRLYSMGQELHINHPPVRTNFDVIKAKAALCDEMAGFIKHWRLSFDEAFEPAGRLLKKYEALDKNLMTEEK